MSTATAESLHPAIGITYGQLTEHQADMARRQKERDAKTPLLRQCLNPAFAAAQEAEKPVYKFRVQAKFDLITDGKLEAVEMDEEVSAQNESDAWAAACDRLKVWPSRRHANPTFKRGKQLSIAEVKVAIETNTAPDKPRRKLTPKPRSKKSL